MFRGEWFEPFGGPISEKTTAALRSIVPGGKSTFLKRPVTSVRARTFAIPLGQRDAEIGRLAGGSQDLSLRFGGSTYPRLRPLRVWTY